MAVRSKYLQPASADVVLVRTYSTTSVYVKKFVLRPFSQDNIGIEILTLQSEVMSLFSEGTVLPP